MSSSIAAQKRTTQAVIDAYNAWDLDAILAFRAPNCISQILPLSMGRPPQNNDEYRTRFGELQPFVQKLYSQSVQENFSSEHLLSLEVLRLTVRTTIHDPESHTSVLMARSTAETSIGKYANDYAVVLTFTEDGEKVVKFEEFVDSAYSKDYFARMAAAAQQEKAQ